jgi:hypothetical protein
MIWKLTIAAAIFVGHVALFTLTYYGRRPGLGLCDSDLFLFGFPFLVAVLAYAALFGRLFAIARRRQRVGVASLVALLVAVGSAVVGMSVAFTLMGT